MYFKSEKSDIRQVIIRSKIKNKIQDYVIVRYTSIRSKKKSDK